MKNFFQKFKIQVGMIGVVLEIIGVVVAQFVAPEVAELVKQVMLYVAILVGVIITGHTVTDVTALIKKGQEDGKDALTRIKDGCEKGCQLLSEITSKTDQNGQNPK